MERTKEQKTYRRLTLLIILIPLLFGLAFNVVSVMVSLENRSMLEQEFRDHAQLQNTLLVQIIEKTFDGMSSVIAIIQEHYTHFSNGQEEFYEMLRRHALIEPSVFSVYVLNDEGLMDFSTQRRLLIGPELGRRLAAAHTQKRMSYHLHFDNDMNRLFMSTNLSDQGFHEVKILVFEIDSNRFFSEIENIETSEMLAGLITDNSGNIISRWKKPGTITDPSSAQDALDYLSRRMAVGVSRYDIETDTGGTRLVDDDKVLIVSSKLSKYPYMVTMLYDKEAYLINWVRSFYRNLLLFGFFLLFSFLGSVYLRRIIIRSYAARQRILDRLEQLVDERTSELQEKSNHLEESNTAYRKVVTELTSSEEYLEAMIDASPVAIISIDADGCILSWNKTAENMFGWREEEVIGKFAPFVEESKIGEFTALRERAVSGESFSQIELTRRKKDGSPIMVSLSTAPITNAEGQVISILSILSDITEKKQSEKKVFHQKQVFQNLFDSSPEAIAVLDNDDTVIDINAAFTELFQYSKDEAKGCRINDLIVPPDQYEKAEHLTATVQASQIVREEATRSKKDNTKVFVSLIGYPNIIFGKQVGMFGIYQDISAQKKIEAQLLHSQKMDSVGRLAGGVAHDFNNMLGVILGYTEMILDQLPPDHPFAEELTEVHSAAQRSADLTRQLLAFARQQTIYPKELDLNEVIPDMLNMLRRIIGEDISLVWIPGRNIGKIIIDPSQIDQLMVNLCVNAREAIADTGKITIETTAVEITEKYCEEHVDSVPGTYVLLAVSDDGCGMDREILDHIFEPFFTTKKTGEGTGLGMATVFGIVSQNQGFINLYSEPGLGTTCKIYLPFHKTTGGGTEKEINHQGDNPGSETVLLVDDDNMVRNMAAKMLEQLGYSVITASTPWEAIEIAKRNSLIDLLITDVIMPEMNGKDLFEALKPHLPNLCCLFMSGYTSNVIVHRGIVDEDVSFIQKPFDRRTMAKKVRDALRPSTGDGTVC